MPYTPRSSKQPPENGKADPLWDRPFILIMRNSLSMDLNIPGMGMTITIIQEVEVRAVR